MSAAVLDRPACGELDLDLRGLDYYTRRRELFTALGRLRAADRLRVTSSGADDLYWLRYEMEARLAHRYEWSPSGESRGQGADTVVRLSD